MNLFPPLRSEVIVGSAVPTAVRSRALRNMDVTRARNESQKADPFPCCGFFARLVLESMLETLGGTEKKKKV